MTRNVIGSTTKDIYDGVDSRHSRKLPQTLHAKARRLMDQINAAARLETLRIPPGNRLEKLSGDLNEYWSVRVNSQWRIIFKWEGSDALNVQIVDYHD